MASVLWFPLYCALVGGLAVGLPLALILFTRLRDSLIENISAAFWNHLDLQAIVEQKLDNDVFDAEVELLIDKKLDDLVLVFKQQIPMASTFLVGGLVDKLKAKSKAEIIKMVPDLKRNLVIRMKRGFDSHSIVKLIPQDIESVLCYRYFMLFCGSGILVGFLMGWVPLLF